MHMQGIKDDEKLFAFDYANAKKIIDRTAQRSGIKCIPNGEKVTWKDLRSSMACDLLKKSWTVDEVNARLGHRPSSSEIDKYINFLAIDRHRPKKKMQQYEMEKLSEELKDVRERERLQAMRNERLESQIKQHQEQMSELSKKLEIVERFERTMKNKA